MHSTFSRKAQLMAEINQSLSLNDYGLPHGIYRTDLVSPPVEHDSEDPYGEASPVDSDEHRQLDLGFSLPTGQAIEVTHPGQNDQELVSSAQTLLEQLGDDELNHAYLPLAYDEGYPALPDGRPFWLNLDFEPPEVYHHFEKYLRQSKDGARQLFLLADEKDPNELNEWYYMYYWGPRARAFDLFRYAQARKAKEERAMALEDEQFLTGQRLTNIGMQFIESDDFQELLTPKIALELVRIGGQLQRINSGLPAQGPQEAGKNNGQHGQSLDVILRSYAQGSGGSGGGGVMEGFGGRGKTIDQEGNDIMDRVLSDPDAANMMQEIIIKLHSGS